MESLSYVYMKSLPDVRMKPLSYMYVESFSYMYMKSFSDVESFSDVYVIAPFRTLWSEDGFSDSTFYMKLPCATNMIMDT